jgi:AraC-like DNA-binding protein
MEMAAWRRADPLLAALAPADVGRFTHAQSHFMQRSRGLEQAILILCVAGRGWIATDDRSAEVVAPAAVVLPPGVPHRYGADDHDPWTILWAHFTGTDAQRYAPPDEGLRLSPLADEDMSQLAALFRRMLDALDAEYTRTATLHASHLLRAVLGTLTFGNVQPAGEPGRSPAVVQRAVRFMRRHLDRALTVEAIATHVGFSASHFAHLFRQHAGCPPIEFLVRLRTQTARHYLDTTDLPVAQIAGLVGYADPLYFSRVFKRVTGQSPSGYRAATPVAVVRPGRGTGNSPRVATAREP